MTELDRRIASGDVPASLRPVLLDVPWDLERVLALDLPVGRVVVAEFAWLLDLPFWRERGRWFAVSPNEVRADPHDHRDQWERTLGADLSLPLHTTDRRGTRVIIDGIHRLLRASIEGRETLPARHIPIDLLPAIARRPTP